MDRAHLLTPKPYDEWTAPFLTTSSADPDISDLIVQEAFTRGINTASFTIPPYNRALPPYAQITVIVMPDFFTNGADLIGFVKGGRPSFPFCTPCSVQCRRNVRALQVSTSVVVPGTVSTLYVKGVILEHRRRAWYDKVVCGWVDTVMGLW